MQDSVILPQWLDNLIFEQLGAKYCRSNADMTVIDWDKKDVLNYLGTYFPRSYAEAYCIFSKFFKNQPEQFANKLELSVFDFGCGTGGELFGLLDCICLYLSHIERVSIVAIDGNYHALRLAEIVNDDYQKRTKPYIKLKIIPLRIDDFYDLAVLDRVLKDNFDIIMTFKAICEFVTKDTFDEHNAYTHFVKTFLPKLKDGGIMLLEDVTSYNNVSQEWLPKMMDAAVSLSDSHVISQNEGYNQQIIVSHTRHNRDVSKVAWRIISKRINSKKREWIIPTKMLNL